MHKIAVLPGDGVGPEITREAVKVLKAAAEKFDFEIEISEALVGGAAYDQTGNPLPKETVDCCLNSDVVLFGAVGGPKWDDLPLYLRPEAGALLPLRKKLGVYANLRPAKIFSPLAGASSLKDEIVNGLDLMVVRELTGGVYFGQKTRENVKDEQKVIETLEYSTSEIERVVRVGFDMAVKRNKKLTSVDKANVLESSRLWREIVNSLAPEYPQVEIQHMLVDNCAMQLVRDPRQFDVIVTENMFGDILSDQSAQLTGSIGMLPSASIGGSTGLYEPIHGSAPDIAGKGKANPIAAVLSAAMMLRHGFGLDKAAQAVDDAVYSVLEAGYRTADIMEKDKQEVNTSQMGDLVIKYLDA
ncbi:MAG: 3-isopropylmalate dehydrogenase [Clostridiales bacterium]|nr:3-isopropylmalate dehydrogenase [Clostridiales bacterium]MCF8022448.1 3-isopropylmalate dehydrogenase [Clostridiales bacterium]